MTKRVTTSAQRSTEDDKLDFLKASKSCILHVRQKILHSELGATSNIRRTIQRTLPSQRRKSCCTPHKGPRIICIDRVQLCASPFPRGRFTRLCDEDPSQTATQCPLRKRQRQQRLSKRPPERRVGKLVAWRAQRQLLSANARAHDMNHSSHCPNVHRMRKPRHVCIPIIVRVS